MKAITYTRYGPPTVVAVAEVPKPPPRHNEFLIRIYATTVTTGDWRARSLNLPAGFGFMGRLVFGIFKPRQPILGTELAGQIEAVGKAVTRFKWAMRSSRSPARALAATQNTGPCRRPG